MKVVILLALIVFIASGCTTTDGRTNDNWAPRINGYIDVGAKKHL